MLSDLDLETAVKRAVALYNRTRSPEVSAKLVFVCPVSVTVSFTGGFCYGCGIMDYVDGFAQQFKVLTGKFELKVSKTREVNPRTFEADFNVKTK
jgi:hypothetical protein